ncbi:hypothetical protein ACL1B4_11565, partial [Corynebacterium striatum]
QHQRIVVPPTSTMKENPLQYRVRGTPVPTTRTRGTNYPKSTVWLVFRLNSINKKLDEHFPDSSTAGKLRYGLFYYDPTDTRAMVPLPSGSSQFNFGQKNAWFILAGLLVPPALLIILLNVAA